MKVKVNNQSLLNQLHLLNQFNLALNLRLISQVKAVINLGHNLALQPSLHRVKLSHNLLARVMSLKCRHQALQTYLNRVAALQANLNRKLIFQVKVLSLRLSQAQVPN